MPHVMETQLDAPAGDGAAAAARADGLHFHLEKATSALLGEAGTSPASSFSDGTTLECDMVVVAAGIRPNVELAVRAGLPVDRGIVVGDDLACRGTPDVYAVGECAEHRGRVYGLVAPLWEQTQVLADRLTGRNPDAVYVGIAPVDQAEGRRRRPRRDGGARSRSRKTTRSSAMPSRHAASTRS